MQKRKSSEGDKPFNELIEDMKIDSIAKSVEEADRRNHVTMELARKLAGSKYFRKKTISTLFSFEREMHDEIIPRYGMVVAPRAISSGIKILKEMYNSNIPYVRLVAINSFDALLDQFTTGEHGFPRKEINEFFYKIVLLSIYLSGQTLPQTDNIHKICPWIYACIGDKTYNDAKNEVNKFLKDGLPISDGRVKSMVVELYDKDISGKEMLRMIRYAAVYHKASRAKVDKSDFIVPNDILVLTQEYKQLLEKFRDRYRYYMDNGSIETIGTIDDFLFRNKIKL